MPWWISLIPIAVDLGESVWSAIAALSEGHLPTYAELLAYNDEVQKKIDAQKVS